MGCLGGSHSQRRWSIGMGSDGKTPGSGSKGCVGPHWAVEFWGPSIIRWLGRSLDSMSSSSYCVFVAQLLSLVRLFTTHGSTPGFPVLPYLPEFAQIHVHWAGDAIWPFHPLSSPSPPALNLSQHQGLLSQLFTSCGQSSASASVLPMNVQDWFPFDRLDLLAVQGTLKSLLQQHSSKASIFPCSVGSIIVQLLHPYMTTRKAIALSRRTFVGKVMSLLFNMLSTLVITFLPRSMHLLISCLQSLSAVALEPKKIKSVTVSTFPNLFVMKWWYRIPWS